PHGGRTVELKVHRSLWSGRYSENSPLAIEECGRENVLRTEIDLQLLRDGQFVIFHDDRFDRATDAQGLVRDAMTADAKRARFRDGTHPLLFAEAVELMAAHEYPTRIELDLKDLAPYSWPQVETLVRAVQPIKARAHFSCPADWNLRRILGVDPTLQVSLNPHSYIDTEDENELALPLGAYGDRGSPPNHRRVCCPPSGHEDSHRGGPHCRGARARRARRRPRAPSPESNANRHDALARPVAIHVAGSVGGVPAVADSGVSRGGHDRGNGRTCASRVPLRGRRDRRGARRRRAPP